MNHSIDFLEQQGEDQEHKQEHVLHAHKRRLFTPAIVALLLILFFGYVIGAVLGAGRVFAASLDARDELRQAQEFALEFKFENAQESLKRAKKHVARAKTGLIILTPLQVVPWVGDQIRGIREVLQASGRLIPALQDAVQIASNITEVVDRAKELSTIAVSENVSYIDLPAGVKRDLLERLHQALPELEKMQQRILLAEQDISSLDDLNLSDPIVEAVAPFREILPALKDTLSFLIPVAAIVPEFGGLSEDQRILVLYQNNTELRPGGGFIGTFGTLVMRDGSILSLKTEDSYVYRTAAEGKLNTVPPEPLARYVGLDAWYFRDGNWSPDFRLTARSSINLMNEERRAIGLPLTSFDSVVALTPSFASDLLEIVGPVTLGGQTFTAENIADTLEYQVEFGFVKAGLPREQRKDIVGDLTDEVVRRLLQLPIKKWELVIDAALKATTEKQLVFYSEDEQTQLSLERAGWGGVLKKPEKDFVMVVDANLASLKTDPVVERSIHYAVRQDSSGRYIGSTSITYNHTGTFDWKTTRYRTYTRVFVPEGSELIEFSGALLNDRRLNPQGLPGEVTIGNESGFTTFGAFTSVEPGERQMLEFIYYLPDRVVSRGIYGLDVIKQIGAANHQLTVDVDFGKSIKSAMPSEDPADFGDTKYLLNTILDQDKQVVVRF